MQPVALDLDGSLQRLSGALVVPMHEQGERLRFACGWRALKRFGQRLETALPPRHGTVLTGSGDFHHLSLPLVARACRRHGPLQVVVFDNHPDNMRFAMGVHCGSWVTALTRVPGVVHVHVVGIASADVSRAHALGNRLRPLRAGRLTYWTVGVDTRWTRRIGLARACRSHDSVADMLEAFATSIGRSDGNIYLSIDKDVLGAEVVRTNWDQGRMSEADLVAGIRVLRGRIVASDITGEVSAPHYAQRWKRLLAALDRQPSVGAEQLAAWQRAHLALDRRLLDEIARCSAPT